MTDKTTQELQTLIMYELLEAQENPEKVVTPQIENIMKIIAKHEAELVESELVEAEKMNKIYSDRGKPNPFYQGQVIVLRHMLTALTEKESKE